MNAKPQPSQWLLSSDVDDTLLGDDVALDRLSAELRQARDAITIVYNSSRPCASLRRSLAEQAMLPLPDYLIGALGTEIEYGASAQPVAEYGQTLAQDWPRDAIAAVMRELGFLPHAPEYQTAFKASFDVPGEDNYRRALDRLAQDGHRVKVIFSAGRNFDIIPMAAGKGQAVEFLRRRLGIESDRVIVAGDSANDRDMFVAPFKGIVVANADETLKAVSGPHVYHARSDCAAGVLEGLRHWGALPARARSVGSK